MRPASADLGPAQASLRPHAWQPAATPSLLRSQLRWLQRGRPGGGSSRCRVQPPPQSFMKNSLELVPGWLKPSWLGEAPGPRAEQRAQRLRALRRILHATQRAPPLQLPPPPGEEAQPEEAGPLDVTHTASNAVPFWAPSSAGGAAAAASLAAALNGGAAGVARADEVRAVLPWLFVAEGRLDFSAMEFLASQLALSGLQLLDVTRFAAAAGASNGHWHSGWGSHVRWAGAQALPSPTAAAAAALRRMELRRGGALTWMPDMEGKAVVLTFHPGHRQLAAETLALYLHAYLGLGGQEAVEAAGRAVGTSPLESTLRGHLEELANIADGWYRRVTLAWPYAGGHVEVVGDAVGGWEQRAPMVFNVKKKRWQLQIWGLQPGIHRYKYLVDGCWVIDLAGLTEADARGNINNIVMVTNTGKPMVQPRDSTDSESDDEGAGAASSSDGDDAQRGGPGFASAAGEGVDGVAAAVAAAVVATVEPPSPVDTAAAAEGGASAAEAPAPPPAWTSREELEALARFGAAVLAFHTRLGVKLRHKLH